ncbi:MAG: penicillin-binding transpeptidase domain-containing protein [Acidobacteriota bacterium]
MSFHQRTRGRRRPLRLLVIFLLAAGLVYLGAGLRVDSILHSGQDALREGRLDQARRRFQDARFYRLHRGRVLEALGAVELARDDLEAARGLLRRAREAGNRRSALDLDALAELLANAARYQAVEILASHRDAAGGAGVAPLWKGEAALALDHLGAAARWLESREDTPPSRSGRRKQLLDLLEKRRRGGRAYTLFDRRGRPLLGRALPGGETVLETPELEDILAGKNGLLGRLSARDRASRITLTLDLSYQKAAHAALGRFGGAFVALDPSSGAILALVNHPARAPDDLPVYRRPFEPGSVLKIVTLAAALEVPLDLDRIFPLICTGNMTLDGKVFYDWTVHSTIPDLDTALAASCNLAFAAIGLDMGQARLDDALGRFGFGKVAPAGDLPLDLGQLQEIDPAAPRLGLASRAVGLKNVTVTPMHLALLAAVVANGGTAMQPYLVASRASLGGGAPYQKSSRQEFLRACQPSTAQRIGAAMRQVVQSPAGTGRRAAVSGLDFAMKTGTAGSRKPRLNAIVVGYAPVDHPVVAFGFVAEHAGKAEREGARIVRDFLSTVRNEFGRSP